MENKNTDSVARFSLLELDGPPTRTPAVTIKPDPIVVVDLSDDDPAPAPVTPVLTRCTYGKISQGNWGLRFADATDLPPAGTEVIAVRRDGTETRVTVGSFAKNGRSGTVIANIQSDEFSPAESTPFRAPEVVAAESYAALTPDDRVSFTSAINGIGSSLVVLGAPVVEVAPAPFAPTNAGMALSIIFNMILWLMARCPRASANDRAIGGLFVNVARFAAIPAPRTTYRVVLPTLAQMAADTARIAAERRERTGRGMSADTFAGDTVDSDTVTSLYTCNSCKTLDQRIAFGGEGAEGLGRRIGWNGRGECTVGQIREELPKYGLPVSWAPTSKSVRAHAGKAVSALAASGYVPRCERKVMRSQNADYAARWHVGAIGSVAQEVGGSFGRTVLIVTLTSMGTLTFEYDDSSVGGFDLAERVRIEFERTTSGDVLKAGEVTEWIKSTMRSHLWAVDTGNGMYVRRQYADQAHTLKKCMSGIFGRNWEAWPVATHAEVKDSLCEGLRVEVSELANDLRIAREVARKAGREDVTEGTGARYVKRLNDIAARVQAFADLIGADRVKDVRKVANDLLESLSGLVSDTALRGRLIWDDIALFDDPPMTPSTNETSTALKG